MLVAASLHRNYGASQQGAPFCVMPSPQDRFLSQAAAAGVHIPKKAGLNRQMSRQSKFTNELYAKVHQPIQGRPGFQAGRGGLFDMLRRLGQAQAGRSAALGMAGGEADVGFAAARGQAAAGGIRDLIGQAAGQQQFDIQALLQSLGMENQLVGAVDAKAEAKKQRIAGIVGQALGSASTILSGGGK